MADPNNSNVKRPVFPVGLLASGRPCLVVGGGRIGLRKVRLLLDAQARVTVLSLDLKPELAELIRGGRVEHLNRPFETDDVDGFFLVFAATSDRSVNAGVLQACREKRIYACSSDKTWPLGDFVTPATVRKDGITVAVSTGGKSCRLSKMIKNSFQRHLEMIETADLIVLGTSHDDLPIQQRETYHLAGSKLEQAGRMLMHVWGVHEFAVVNTCNRVELHAVACATADVEQILRQIMNFDHLGTDDFHIKRGSEAFGHLSVLGAGLLSQTPGEKHIVAQLKDSMTAALENGWAGTMMRQWYDSALHVSKDIRRETEGLLQNRGIEELCLLYLDREAPDWHSRNVMVVGTGVIGTSICGRLTEMGMEVQWCYHRNEPVPAADVEHLIHRHSLNELRNHLSQTDVVICATGGQGHVVHMDHAPFFDPEKDTLVIDLAMPRNVDPDLGALGDHLKVLDLDDLKHWHRKEVADLSRIFEIGNSIVDNHKGMYEKLIHSFQGGNTLQ